jgi:hypothetical protein
MLHARGQHNVPTISVTVEEGTEQASGYATCARASSHAAQNIEACAQISYAVVFFLEYLGPLLIYPFFWAREGRLLLHGVDTRGDARVYANVVPRVPAQDLACFYWFLHYTKARSRLALLMVTLTVRAA